MFRFLTYLIFIVFSTGHHHKTVESQREMKYKARDPAPYLLQTGPHVCKSGVETRERIIKYILLGRIRALVDTAYCYKLSSVVCRSVCRSVTVVSHAKTVEPIEMPFGMCTRVGQRII